MIEHLYQEYDALYFFEKCGDEKMIQIAICDDAEKDIVILQRYVEKYMDIRKIQYNITIFRTGEDLLNANISYDILLLDIVMGQGINGIIAGRKFRAIYTNTKIIYTTHFSQYCAQAINKVHAFAYLEKPIIEEQIFEQLDEVLKSVFKERNKKEFINFEIIKISKEHRVDSILKEFEVDFIYYFEYINRRICIKTKEGDYYFYGQMKKLINRMKEYKFECCHQSYLINLKYVKRIKGYDLYLKNGERIPVSQKKSAEFRKKLNEYIQNNI